MNIQRMTATHPDVDGYTADSLTSCIEECYDCAQTCTSCADTCLVEDMVNQLRQCIRLCLDCADICVATALVASRRT